MVGRSVFEKHTRVPLATAPLWSSSISEADSYERLWGVHLDMWIVRKLYGRKGPRHAKVTPPKRATHCFGGLMGEEVRHPPCAPRSPQPLRGPLRLVRFLETGPEPLPTEKPPLENTLWFR
ncbi:hypothetical protein FA13DRAFT_804230 [Coprinellus micaceus]|uniref:Uncharacterized protein n=1 Tax=Coprinellus micaceus TaxID=71717 RepID=A0A4Y7T2X9_COPMI|nr:hypothetical protein FA13DRAFT_804230 [Coprinellus micaceus]